MKVQWMAVSAFCACLTVSAFGADAAMRVWKSADGRAAVTAALVRVEGETIVIRRNDGTLFTSPAAKFSAADRDYARQAAAPKRAGVNWLAWIGGIIGLWLCWRFLRECREWLALLAAKAKVARIGRSGRMPVIDAPSVVLKAGETALWSEKSILFEPATVRHSVSSGVSYRVCKDVYLHSGRSESRASVEWSRMGKGQLIVTSQRVIFIGGDVSRELSVVSLADVRQEARAVRLSEGERTHVFTSRNGYYLSWLIRNSAALLVANRASKK